MLFTRVYSLYSLAFVADNHKPLTLESFTPLSSSYGWRARGIFVSSNHPDPRILRPRPRMLLHHQYDNMPSPHCSSYNAAGSPRSRKNLIHEHFLCAVNHFTCFILFYVFICIPCRPLHRSNELELVQCVWLALHLFTSAAS